MMELATLPYSQDTDVIPQNMLDDRGLQRIIVHIPRGEEKSPNSTEVFTSTVPQGLADANLSKISVEPIFPEADWRLSSSATQRFIASKKWEGVVNKIDKEFFLARLVELNATKTIEEDAELLVTDVSEDDMELFKEGATFFFSVGYRISEAGTYERTSRIRFQRLPKWTADEILEAHSRAKEIIKKIRIE